MDAETHCRCECEGPDALGRECEGVCLKCGDAWPCDTAHALARAAKAEKALKVIRHRWEWGWSIDEDNGAQGSLTGRRIIDAILTGGAE